MLPVSISVLVLGVITVKALRHLFIVAMYKVNKSWYSWAVVAKHPNERGL